MSQITDKLALEALRQSPETLFSIYMPLTFVSNTDSTSNFELKASTSYSTDSHFKGFGIYTLDALAGTTFNVELKTGYYGDATAIIYSNTGDALIASFSESSDVIKKVTMDFVAPYTGKYALFSSVDTLNKDASLTIRKDQDTSPEYTPTPTVTSPEPQQKITNQKLVGTSKSDNLIGGDGNDTLTGGVEFDTLTGGKGADKFVYKSIKDAPISHSKIEVIIDFSSSEKDKIDLSAIDADTSKAKDQAFSKPKMGAEFSGVFKKAGELFFDTTNQILYGNVNADETADFAIKLSGVTNLSASDFIL